MRFNGSMNIDINEIITNMVPYNKLHFLLSSLSPLYTFKNMELQSGPKVIDTMVSDAFKQYIIII